MKLVQKKYPNKLSSISLLLFPQLLKGTSYVVLVFRCQKIKLFFLFEYLGLKRMALCQFQISFSEHLNHNIRHLQPIIQIQNCIYISLKPFPKSADIAIIQFSIATKNFIDFH